MRIVRIDHLVLTVKDIDVSVDFYSQALGMKKVVFGAGRIALLFGEQKINLHQLNQEIEPKAKQSIPGSADLCFILETPLEQARLHLQSLNIPILLGPVIRTGACHKIQSIYIRDPDQNLIEISNEILE